MSSPRRTIWLVTVGEPLPVDADPRLFRCGLLAEELTRRGHDVVWWTSSFDHSNKRRRQAGRRAITTEHGSYELRLLPSLGYRANMGPRRLLDHSWVALGYLRQSRRLDAPDLVVSSLPTLELCAASAWRGWKQVVDVRDLWPDIFDRGLPVRLRPLGRLLFAPWRLMARYSCSRARAIAGTSEPFVEWGLDLAGRPRTADDRSFPFGYPPPPPADEVDAADDVWESSGVARTDPCVAFVGTIGPNVDLETVVDAAKLVGESHPELRFVLCGTGPDIDHLRRLAADLPNVVFPGFVGRAAITALLRHSVVGLAPYHTTFDFTMTLSNKTIEYLSQAVPILTSVERGVVVDLLARTGCGQLYRAGDAADLADRIAALAAGGVEHRTMSAAAGAVFEAEFTAAAVYGAFADHLEHLADPAGGR